MTPPGDLLRLGAMSNYFFDDFKDHAYKYELDEHRTVHRPAISPGKVTLTSRIVRAVPLAANSHQSTQTAQPTIAPVQRKAETPMRSDPGADSEMSTWDIAFRPDLYEAPETVSANAHGQQRHQPSPGAISTACIEDAGTENSSMAVGPDPSDDMTPGKSLAAQVATMPETKVTPNLEQLFGEATQGNSQQVPYRADMESAYNTDFSAVRAYIGTPRPLELMGAEAAASGETLPRRSWIVAGRRPTFGRHWGTMKNSEARR